MESRSKEICYEKEKSDLHGALVFKWAFWIWESTYHILLSIVCDKYGVHIEHKAALFAHERKWIDGFELVFRHWSHPPKPTVNRLIVPEFCRIL